MSPSPVPPQTTISLPVQTAVCHFRAAGALVVVVAVQALVVGLYRPPVLNLLLLKKSVPPQIIISLPDQIAAWSVELSAALAHTSVFGDAAWPADFIVRLAAHLSTLRVGGMTALLSH